MSPTRRDVRAALAVTAGGFVLLNLTFISYFLLVSAADALLPGEGAATEDWARVPTLGLFLILVGLASWRVLRSGLDPLPKAIYLTVPIGVAYATLGVLLYRWPAMPIGFGALLFAGVFAYLRRSGQPWIYTYSLVIVSLAMLVITATGTDV